MLKTSLLFLVLSALLFVIPLFAQPGIKVDMSTSALQSSQEDFRPFLLYEVSWLQDGTSNPVFKLQFGVFYTDWNKRLDDWYEHQGGEPGAAAQVEFHLEKKAAMIIFSNKRNSSVYLGNKIYAMVRRIANELF